MTTRCAGVCVCVGGGMGVGGGVGGGGVGVGGWGWGSGPEVLKRERGGGERGHVTVETSSLMYICLQCLVT